MCAVLGEILACVRETLSSLRGSLSSRGAKFDIACSTLLSLCECQLALVVARCEFGYRAQPSRHFVRLGQLSWRGAFFLANSRRSLPRDLVSPVEGLSLRIWREFHSVSFTVEVLTWRSWPRSFKGLCKKIVWRSWWNPLRGPCMILYR